MRAKKLAPGFFIAFEGPEGAGKTTQIGRLAEKLAGRGLAPLITREPGGTPAADAIRQVVLEPAFTIGPLAEFLLYSASRAQHVDEVVRPALERGRIVISDRFAGASVAYQGYGRGLELPFVKSLTERVTSGLRPDLTLLLDLEPEAGLARVAGRGQKDRLERADLSFHRRVRQGFLEQARGDESWVVLDASLDEAALAGRVWAVVGQRLDLEGPPLPSSPSF